MRSCKLIVVFCLACSFLIPIRVYAESTYSVYEQNTCIKINKRTTSYVTVELNNDGRMVIVKDNNNIYYFCFVFDSLTKFREVTGNQNIACPTGAYSNTSLVNGYYTYNQVIAESYISNFNVPIVNVIDNSVTNTSIYYTYGAGAVEPAPPLPDYGDLIDVRFNTSIAGSGDASINNIDHITWNPEHDSNEIMYDGTERVQIRAIAGNYTSSTKNGLLGAGVTDFDYNSSAENMLAEYPVTRGYYDVTWSHVIEQLHAGSISDFLQIRKSNDVWLKSGWIYQIRLISGDYEGNWITIYNATSSGVQNSLTIENSTEINTTLINTIQQINNLNNSVDEDWTINNITINMENSDGNTTTDKPWWAYLLEAIVSLCSGILSFLGGLIGDLIEAILGLFQPAEFTINNYNDFKIEFKQNSGIFGQSFDFISTLKNTFLGVEYQEPIIHWSGISFGETELIPAADYNLNDYVTMWGLSDFRQMAYLCSDGFIYLSLLVLIMRKLNEVLKK